ncbi:MAG: hypothetical protein FWH18_03700, partial [Marinilabiliaceae bacterium]|nr:hypothetical protein [Marinilabiliaceae bacterium]
MKMFVWIVTALFCGAGAGAATVHIVWQQRIDAERQEEIVRVEAGKITDEDAEIFIKMIEKFEELVVKIQIDTDEVLNSLTSPEKEVFFEYLTYFQNNWHVAYNIGEQGGVQRGYQQGVQQGYQQGLQQGYQQGYQQGIRDHSSQSYSQQPTQPSQSYSQQPSQSYSEQPQQQPSRRPNIEVRLCAGSRYYQFYMNGSFTYFDGSVAINGRYEIYESEYGNTYLPDITLTYNNGRVEKQNLEHR